MTFTDPANQVSKRRDEEGDFHAIEAQDCPDCGCVCFVAKEDATLIWEPGAAWDEGCRDRSCHCHEDPVIGARRG